MTYSHEGTSATLEDGIEARLAELITLGYQFVHPTDSGGDIVAIVGVRAHDGVVDVVKLHAENDVQAARMPGDEADIMAPATVLWQETGSVRHVLDELLALPDQRGSHALAGVATRESSGCWVPVRTGSSTWLPASG